MTRRVAWRSGSAEPLRMGDSSPASSACALDGGPASGAAAGGTGAAGAWPAGGAAGVGEAAGSAGDEVASPAGAEVGGVRLAAATGVGDGFAALASLAARVAGAVGRASAGRDAGCPLSNADATSVRGVPSLAAIQAITPAVTDKLTQAMMAS